jgi:hypothetical protein
MDLLISEILEKVSKVKTKQEKVNLLREYNHDALRMVNGWVVLMQPMRIL